MLLSYAHYVFGVMFPGLPVNIGGLRSV